MKASYDESTFFCKVVSCNQNESSQLQWEVSLSENEKLPASMLRVGVKWKDPKWCAEAQWKYG